MIHHSLIPRVSHGRAVATMINCDIIASNFEIKVRYNVWFPINTTGREWTSFIPPALTNVTTLLL